MADYEKAKAEALAKIGNIFDDLYRVGIEEGRDLGHEDIRNLVMHGVGENVRVKLTGVSTRTLIGGATRTPVKRAPRGAVREVVQDVMRRHNNQGMTLPEIIAVIDADGAEIAPLSASNELHRNPELYAKANGKWFIRHPEKDEATEPREP